MKRVMLDTNVYGELILDGPILAKIEERIKKNAIVVYGSKVIRDELRDLSSLSRLGQSSMRILLLNLYDRLCLDHNIKVGEIIEILANKYYAAYKKSGGKEPFKEMRNDFLIVACASIKELDIVVSHDSKTMLAQHALEAYKKVNTQNGLRDPEFISYQEYKRKLKLIDSPM